MRGEEAAARGRKRWRWREDWARCPGSAGRVSAVGHTSEQEVDRRAGWIEAPVGSRGVRRRCAGTGLRRDGLDDFADDSEAAAA